MSQSPAETPTITYKLFQRHSDHDAGYWAILSALYAGGRALLRNDKVLEEIFPQHNGEEGFVYAERKRRAAYVFGRTLLVTNRQDWAPEQAVLATRLQSHNERFFRDIKDPAGVSILPLRHRRDAALRVHAVIAVLALLLVKVLQRRLKRVGVPAPSVASVLKPLKGIQRARLRHGADAPPALRALAKNAWIRSDRSPRQEEILAALGLASHPALGTTVPDALKGSARRRSRRAAK